MKQRKHGIKRLTKRPEALMVGVVYKSIARKWFAEKRQDMTKEQVEEFLQHGRIDKLDATLALMPIISVVTNALRHELAEEGIRVPRDFAEVMAYSETPEEDVEEVAVEVRMRKFTDEEKEGILERVLMALAEEVSCDDLDLLYNLYLEDIFKLVEM